jgi:hypothetical protein
MGTTPNLILAQLETRLRTALSLTAMQCYVSAAPAYIEGQDQRVLQIGPGSEEKDGPGNGAQDGGLLIRRMRIVFTYWYRLKLDKHGHSREVLLDAGTGIMDFFQSLKDKLALTWLKTNGVFLLTEPMRWENESQPSWHDADAGVMRKDAYYSASWGEDRPSSVTL